MAIVQLVQKVLTIATRVLLGVCAVAGVVCLAYTLASSAVQRGFDALGSAWDDATSSAWATLVDEAQRRLAESSSAATEADAAEGAGAGSGSGIGGALSGLASLVGLGSGGDTSAQSFADPALGADYQAWKDAVSSPVERVFGGTGIDTTTLEAAAGGSSSATNLLAKLDEPTLAAVSANADKLKATAGSHAVPASLPADVQAQMRQADQHCVAFCDDVKRLVDDVRTLKGGNILAGAAVSSSAYAARDDLEQMESCMQAAERSLGA